MSSSVIVQENLKLGTSKSIWDAPSSNNIEGFATDISINHGNTVSFKVNLNVPDADTAPYHIEIYRLGYYGGDGATLVTTIGNLTGIAQADPVQSATGLVDAGNWLTSASWAVPTDAVSGVYLAKLVRDDTGESNQIPFIVRADETRTDGTRSDLIFQTSDTSWQAYNGWGGKNGTVGADFYGGNVAHPGVADPGLGSPNRTYEVSYNRPIITRDGTSPASGAQDYLFGAEYAAIYWLEKNGYDVSYQAGVDTDRLGSANLIGHKTYLSVGHDEYWSGDQRANVEAARDAGVNLAFLSGNEVYWKTRYADSTAATDGAPGDHRTLVCYKETWANLNANASAPDYANIDPSDQWTGTWRDARFVDSVDAQGHHTAIGGGRPENQLTGQLLRADGNGQYGAAVDVAGQQAALRFWRDTSVAATGTGHLATGILGYEFDASPDDAYRPAGLIKLSSTTVHWNTVLVDQGNSTPPGDVTHNLTLYKAPSGALVFGAGTVFWSWGLSDQHDSAPYGGDIANTAIQQAMVNLFADMGVQPGEADSVLAAQGLVRATASTDTVAPTTTLAITGAPTHVTAGQAVTITGTATDDDGNPLTADGQVAAVEVSTDGGSNWLVATGLANWTYTWTASGVGAHSILARAIDDSLNIAPTGTLQSAMLTVDAPPPPTGFSLFTPGEAAAAGVANDGIGYELGVKFQSDTAGTITQLEYYRAASDAGDTDVRNGHLWAADGTLLAMATFASAPGQSGWQVATLSTPVTIQPGTIYVASYHTDNNYVYSAHYFSTAHAGPDGYLTAPASGTVGGNGVYSDSVAPFPNQSYNDSNYWIDVSFTPAAAGNQPPQITSAAIVGVAENQTAVTTVTAIDADLPAQTLGYAIVLASGDNGAGADGALFSIDAVTGALAFKASPDFEAPRDAGADNVYHVTVAATDSAGGSVQQTIAVTVGNVAEAATPSGSFDAHQIKADYIFGTTAASLFAGAGASQTATVDATPGAVEFGDLPSAGGDVGNGQYGLARIDIGSTTIRIDYPLDASVFSSSNVVNFASATSHPYNGVLLTGADGHLPRILGVSIVDQAGFGTPLAAANLTVTSDGLFLNVAGNSRLVDIDPGTPGAQSSYVTLAVDFNDAPVLTSNGGGAAAAISHATAATLVATLAATDADAGQTLSYSILSAAGGGGEDAALFTISNGNELHFASAPDAANPPAAGATPGYQVTVEVADGFGGFDTQDITVTLPLPDTAPVANPDTAATAFNTPVTIAVLANDTDADSDPLTIAAAGSGAHGSVQINSDGTLTYTPDTGYIGVDSFGYTIDDGRGGTSSSTVTIGVGTANHAPAAAADSVVTAEDTAVFVDVLGNDSDADGDSLTVTAAGGASNGTVVNNGNGVTYTPNADFNGADSFTYSVSDGHGGSSTATVSVGVTPVNDPPVAAADTAVTDEDTPVTIAVLGNDSDVEGDTLTVAAVTSGAHGAVAINNDGTVTYTPNLNFNGSDSFSYTVSDGHGGSSTASVAIDIAPVDDGPPVITAITPDTGSSATDGITATGLISVSGTAEVGGTVTLHNGIAVAGTAIADSSGNWTIALATALADGAHSLTATTTDGSGNVSAASAALRVTVDTLAPGVTLALAHDTGTSATDRVTTDATLTGLSDALATVTLREGATVLGTTIADAAGLWSFAPVLANGAHSISASSTDTAGNTGTSTLSFGLGEINGTAGNDTLDGSGGDWVLRGGAGNDTYVAIDGADQVIELAGEGIDTVRTATGSYTLGANVENLVFTGSGDFTGNGNALDNAVTGGTGNDTLTGGAGADALDGGFGIDTASYASAGAAVKVSLLTGTGSLGDATGDTLTGIENLTGSAFNDTLTGDSGNNFIEGGAGNDIIDGGLGVDTAGYAGATAGVTVTLAKTTAQNTLGAGTDTIVNVENLTGSAFNDVLTGSSGANVLRGGDGNDILDGGAGNDVLDGGAGIDTAFYGSAAAAVIVSLAIAGAQSTGGSAVDTLTGIENLTGSNYNDTLTGDAGNNVISGGSGNDLIDGGAGDDSLDGGVGIDTLTYAAATAGVSVNLALLVAQVTGGAGTDIIVNFENLTGSAYADTLTGNAAANVLTGGSGDDVLDGGLGNDTLSGGTGIDTASYASAAGGVIVSLALTTAQNTVAAGTDTLLGIENLTGSGFNDTLTGSAGDNLLSGGGGNDILSGGLGNDILDGGSGSDTASYAAATAAVTVSLALTGAQNSGAAGIDTLIGIENITGSSFNDTLTGDGGNNILSSGSGNDLLDGGAGNDTLDGGSGIDTATYDSATAGVSVNLGIVAAQNTLGAGVDTLTGIENLTGSTFDDTLTGNAFANILKGGIGNDILDGGAGNDTLDGGSGIDTASYASATAGVAVNLAVATAQNTLGAGVDTLTGIERLIGSGFNDTLTGNSGDNGIDGGAGSDRLTGGAGADMLTGGTGADTFNFASLLDSTVALPGRDTILDFSHGDGDRIDLHLIDAISGGGDNAFVFSTAFTGVAGQLVAGIEGSHYVVQGDVNGDGVADFAIGVFAAAPLVAADFVL